MANRVLQELGELAVTAVSAVVGFALLGGALLVMYGVVTIILRSAFGIELPNPILWLPSRWQP
jgi:hypothetical protein